MAYYDYKCIVLRHPQKAKILTPKTCLSDDIFDPT